MELNSRIQKVNLASKFSQFSDHWNPRIIGELNGQHVRIVKFQGPFTWHKHDHEDEMFLVVEGEFVMELEDQSITLSAGEFVIIPRNTMHRPVAEHEVQVLLFEPATTVNTGNEKNDLTRDKLERI